LTWPRISSTIHNLMKTKMSLFAAAISVICFAQLPVCAVDANMTPVGPEKNNPGEKDLET